MEVKLEKRHALFYEYVGDITEKRAPHRPAHLELLREYESDGRILEGGALGDPPTGALIVFASDDPKVAEEFAGKDPYVTAGLVAHWRVEPWMVVV